MKKHAELSFTLHHPMAGPQPAGPPASDPSAIQGLNAPPRFFWEHALGPPFIAIPRRDQLRINPCCAVFVLAALLQTTIVSVGRAQTNVELNARDRIVTAVLGKGARTP